MELRHDVNKDPQKILVIKLNTQRQETWRYQGQIISHEPNSILIEAFFDREDFPFHGITLRKNDRFLERYYADRWYNIFEIHDREDDGLKGWYCNVTTPAQIGPKKITYVDLALDLLVYPSGDYLVLDEDEFNDMDIDHPSRLKAHHALNELIQITKSGGMKQAINQTTR